jgi:hypothetical protein
MTASLPPKPVNLPAEPPLTRMSNELNKLARARRPALQRQSLIDQVQSLSGTVQQMASTMNGKAGEDGAQRQLTSLFAIDARPTLTDKDHPHGPSPRRQ